MSWKGTDENAKNTIWLELCKKEASLYKPKETWGITADALKNIILTKPIVQRDARFLDKSKPLLGSYANFISPQDTSRDAKYIMKHKREYRNWNPYSAAARGEQQYNTNPDRLIRKGAVRLEEKPHDLVVEGVGKFPKRGTKPPLAEESVKAQSAATNVTTAAERTEPPEEELLLPLTITRPPSASGSSRESSSRSRPASAAGASSLLPRSSNVERRRPSSAQTGGRLARHTSNSMGRGSNDTPPLPKSVQKELERRIYEDELRRRYYEQKKNLPNNGTATEPYNQRTRPSVATLIRETVTQHREKQTTPEPGLPEKNVLEIESTELDIQTSAVVSAVVKAQKLEQQTHAEGPQTDDQENKEEEPGESRDIEKSDSITSEKETLPTKEEQTEGADALPDATKTEAKEEEPVYFVRPTRDPKWKYQIASSDDYGWSPTANKNPTVWNRDRRFYHPLPHSDVTKVANQILAASGGNMTSFKGFR